jgi:outer membrane protein assembly factor BamD
MAALCSVKNSPNYQLDQSETQGAIDELQLFMNRFPLSSKKYTCNKIIDGLVIKLEKKAFENAFLYYKTENYKSAMIAFKGVLEDFPASSQKNEIMLLIVKAGYKYAVMSIDSKKEERYNETLKNYNNFASLFTESDKKEEAEGYYKNAVKDLENLKSTVKK